VPNRSPTRDHRHTDVDPTPNVVALTEAANQRQDDLRVETNRRIDTEIINLREVGTLRALHAKEMNAAEANRLNSIRTVDIAAVNTAAERSLAAINTLAAQTASNAENLRNALNTTATTIATQWTNTVAGINERLSALERSSYEGKGKQAVVDPQVAELVLEMRSLRESRAGTTGKNEGISVSWGVLLAVATLIAALFAGGVFSRPAPVQAVVPAPIIMVPAPTGTLLPTTPPAAAPR
jgi:hypothetical protein